MATVIQNLLNHALGDGARSTKFEVSINLPDSTYFPDSNSLKVLTKTSSFPGRTHETVDIKYKGRSIPIKGQNKYSQTWECTFYLSEDHKLKQAFEAWMEALDQKHNYIDFDLSNNDPQKIKNLQNNFSNFESYTSTMMIQQLNFDGDKAQSQYFLYNVFPTSVSQVDVSADSVGTILEFTVTFSYSHYSIDILESTGSAGSTGTIVGDLVDSVKGKIQSKVNGIKNLASSNFENIGNNILTEVKDIGNGIYDSLSDFGEGL